MTALINDRRSSLLLVAVSLIALILEPSTAFSFLPNAHRTIGSTKYSSASRQVCKPSSSSLFASNDDDDVPKALLPSSDNDGTAGEPAKDQTSASPSGSVSFMITREMKRVLVEELGYSRKDVDAMRVELAGPIIDKRMRCPETGMPEDWIDQSRALASRLENESKYPLKVPLLLVSAVLFGKGLSDAVVTLIKVNMDFKGASLTQEFMGVNILAIDAVCIALGVALGVWTWQTMRDTEK